MGNRNMSCTYRIIVSERGKSKKKYQHIKTIHGNKI